jgi:hypothetical protein
LQRFAVQGTTLALLSTMKATITPLPTVAAFLSKGFVTPSPGWLSVTDQAMNWSFSIMRLAPISPRRAS